MISQCRQLSFIAKAVLAGLVFSVVSCNAIAPQDPLDTAKGSWRRYEILCEKGQLLEAAIELDYLFKIIGYADFKAGKEGRVAGHISEGTISRMQEPLFRQCNDPRNLQQLVWLAECHETLYPGLEKRVRESLAGMLGKPSHQEGKPDTVIDHELVEYYEQYRELLRWDGNTRTFQRDIPRPARGLKLPAGFEAVGKSGLSKDGYPLRIICLKDGAEMVYVPPGQSTNRTITFTTERFYIDRLETSNAQYSKFCKETGVSPPGYDSVNWGATKGPRNLVGHDDPLQPVACIRKQDAMAYAKWAGKELPTSHEWLRAAYGDSEANYPWGNLPEPTDLKDDKYGRYPGNMTELEPYAVLERHGDARRPEKVGGRPKGASPFGAEDMVGNISEFVADKYEQSVKVYGDGYGASWLGAHVRSLYMCREDEYGPDVGFRCVLRLAE